MLSAMTDWLYFKCLLLCGLKQCLMYVNSIHQISIICNDTERFLPCGYLQEFYAECFSYSFHRLSFSYTEMSITILALAHPFTFSIKTEHLEMVTLEIDSQEKTQSKQCQMVMTLLGAVRPECSELHVWVQVKGFLTHRICCKDSRVLFSLVGLICGCQEKGKDCWRAISSATKETGTMRNIAVFGFCNPSGFSYKK